MSVQGVWSDAQLDYSECTLAYNGSSPILESLTLPQMDYPFKKIDLLEVRVNSATPLNAISFKFFNRGSTIAGTERSTAIGNVTHIDPHDNTVYGNHYNIPLLLASRDTSEPTCKTGKYRLNLVGLNDVPLNLTYAYLRLRIWYHPLSGITVKGSHEPQILMV